MTDETVREDGRRIVLDTDEVRALERNLAENGTSLATLMDRAGRAVAAAVRLRVPNPAPIVVLAGMGNNGGDGWTAARALAEIGYPVTLVTPDIAERLHAEPARSTALEVSAEITERDLPLHVLVSPETVVLTKTVYHSVAIVDAMLGTGFSGEQVREPYASWIEIAKRRRFKGIDGNRLQIEGGDHPPEPVDDAPFAVSADVPSGLSAQTGAVAHPCFVADVTVTMLAYKPGVVASTSSPWTGVVRLAKLGATDAE